MTLSEITEKNDQVGVIELGMSEPGEMTVIANTPGGHGGDHQHRDHPIGQLGSQEKYLKGKASYHRRHEGRRASILKRRRPS